MVNPCLGDANLKAEQANHRKRFFEISLNGGGGKLMVYCHALQLEQLKN